MNTTSLVGWTPEPQTRGTMGLVWSCLATIFLCTWNAVHPNLPAEKDSAWRILRRRVRYMMLALVAPEYVCFLALDERLMAHVVRLKSHGWSLTKSFFLVMGGFVVQSDSGTLYSSVFDVLKLFERKKLCWPDKSLEAEIRDRSKADWVLKVLALVQVTWFIAQVLGRTAQRLPLTTLELFSLGIISCTILTYIAWWPKPFDVRTPMVLKLQGPLPTDIDLSIGRALLLNRSKVGYSDSLILRGSTVLITLVFGALHLVAWRFYFPTELERWFWRVSSVMCVIMPLLMVGILHLSDRSCHVWAFYAMTGLHMLSRVYMMVEMFTSLRRVPADVYRAPQWSQYFPSFG